MFRIGISELGLVCAIVLLILFVPVMISRSYARLDKRLKDIEKKLDKKK